MMEYNFFARKYIQLLKHIFEHKLYHTILKQNDTNKNRNVWILNETKKWESSKLLKIFKFTRHDGGLMFSHLKTNI